MAREWTDEEIRETALSGDGDRVYAMIRELPKEKIEVALRSLGEQIKRKQAEREEKERQWRREVFSVASSMAAAIHESKKGLLCGIDPTYPPEGESIIASFFDLWSAGKSYNVRVERTPWKDKA